MTIKSSKAASDLSSWRWKKTPKALRGQFVGHNGKRPKVYHKPCPLTGGRHRFKGRVCQCGQEQLTKYQRHIYGGRK